LGTWKSPPILTTVLPEEKLKRASTNVKELLKRGKKLTIFMLVMIKLGLEHIFQSGNSGTSLNGITM
jgi:hypothetical protein